MEQPPSPRRRPFSRGLRLAVAALPVLILLGAGLLLAIARLPAVQDRLAALAEAALTGPNATAAVRGLSGPLPFALRLERFAMADGDGVWLEAEDVALDWNPWALLRGRIEVTALEAGRVHLVRPPLAEPTPSEEDPEPLWPPPAFSLPPLRVARLEVASLELGEALLGKAAVFSLQGRLAAAGEQVEATLDLPRVDGHPSALALRAVADLAAWTLDLDAALEEGPGGLLAGLLHLPDTMPLAGECRGNGSLADWNASLSAAAGEAPLLSGTLRLQAPPRADRDAALDLALTLHPRPELLPADAPPESRKALALLGPAVVLRLGAAASPDLARLAIPSLELTAAPVSLRGEARLTPDGMSSDLRLAVADLAPFSPLLGTDAAATPLAGALDIAARLRGAAMRPEALLDLGMRRATLPGLPGARVESLTCNATAIPLADLDDPFRGLASQGTLEVAGLVLPEGGPRLGPVQTLRWTLEADAGGGMRVSECSLKDGGAVLKLTGPLHPAGPFDLAFRLDGLSLAERLPGPSLAGMAVLQGRAWGDLANATARLDANASLSALRGGGELVPLLELTGREPTLSLAAASEGGVASLSRFHLRGAALELDATGRLEANQTLDALATLRLSRLAPLASLASLSERALDGEATLRLQAGGTVATPALRLHLDAPRLALAEAPVRSLRLDLDATDLAAPAGRLSFTARTDPGDLSLDVDYALDHAGLALRRLRLTGPGAAMSGDLLVDLQAGLAEGMLTATSGNLASLGSALGFPLGGALDLALTLSRQGGGQDVQVKAGARSLAVADASLRSLQLEGSLRDVARSPQGSVQLKAESLAAGEMRLGGLTVTGKGAPGGGGGMQFTVAAREGEAAGAPFKAELAGVLSASEQGMRCTLSRLQGAWKTLDIKSLNPFTLEQGDGGMALTNLALAVGPARLKASLRQKPDSLTGELQLAALDLASLQALGAPGAEGLSGRVEAAVILSGTPVRPQVKLSLRGTDLLAPGMTGGATGGKAGGMPALQLSANATLGPDKATLLATVAGLGDPLRLDVSLPAVFRLEPFALQFKDQGLTGTVKGAVDLARFSSLLEAHALRCRGRLAVDVAVAGSLESPQVSGGARLDNGFLEAADVGAVLSPVTMDVKADRAAITVQTLTAKDRSGGSFSASGAMSLDAVRRFPYSLKLTFHDFTPVRHELGNARLKGELAVTGDATAGRLVGALTVDPASVSLPTSLPPGVAPVEQLEFVGPGGSGSQGVGKTGKKAAGKRGAAASSYALDLDVAVEIPNSLKVSGLGVDSQWQGSLKIKGRAERPAVTGLVAVTRGQVSFLGKRFVLEKGEIGFGGDFPPDPLLAVDATTDAGDVTAILSLRGHASGPELTLRSDPSLPREEVLSRILFGRELQNLSPLQAVQLAKAGGLLLGSQGLTGLLGKGDSLIPGLSRKTDDGAPPSALEKIIDHASNNVRLDVRQPVGRKENEIQVEVDVTQDVMLHGTVDDAGRQGAGVSWKHDY